MRNVVDCHMAQSFITLADGKLHPLYTQKNVIPYFYRVNNAPFIYYAEYSFSL
jgi:hypothetical protein